MTVKKTILKFKNITLFMTTKDYFDEHIILVHGVNNHIIQNNEYNESDVQNQIYIGHKIIKKHENATQTLETLKNSLLSYHDALNTLPSVKQHHTLSIQPDTVFSLEKEDKHYKITVFPYHNKDNLMQGIQYYLASSTHNPKTLLIDIWGILKQHDKKTEHEKILSYKKLRNHISYKKSIQDVQTMITTNTLLDALYHAIKNA